MTVNACTILGVAHLGYLLPLVNLFTSNNPVEANFAACLKLLSIRGASEGWVTAAGSFEFSLTELASKGVISSSSPKD
jgi:hypothetical protein